MMRTLGRLSNFAIQHNQPWMLAGDFNEMRSMTERKNCNDDLSRRRDNFNHWIKNNGFIDLGFSGSQFTWNRGRNPETPKYAILDRALCNEEWRLQFQEAVVKHLLQNQSDHCPLLIVPHGFTTVHHLQRPFRFQAAWLSHEKFAKCLKDNWKTSVPIYPLLSQMGVAFDKWNKEVFVSIIPLHLEDFTVEEMWDPLYGWKWDLFVDILPQDIVKAIVSFELRPGDEVGDQLVWKASSNGSFTIKSALSLIKDEIPKTPNPA
ncbi:hypothetical protein Cgig2_009235 [Carnegiea gigantea]|uniref:Endonuclease/exonuclease/phosphatase domain-containing protein n=1 Tax=Carnegiea gigantea TaxID=171969 RepID=A0A9Q1QEF6_9CARY|nr:hypothetical protein Cgig2_009235 [Carnegiea gigantea]